MAGNSPGEDARTRVGEAGAAVSLSRGVERTRGEAGGRDSEFVGASNPACRLVKGTVRPGDEVGPAAFDAGARTDAKRPEVTTPLIRSTRASASDGILMVELENCVGCARALKWVAASVSNRLSVWASRVLEIPIPATSPKMPIDALAIVATTRLRCCTRLKYTSRSKLLLESTGRAR